MEKSKKFPFSRVNYFTDQFGRKKRPKFIPFKQRYQKELKNAFFLLFNSTSITSNLELKKVGLIVSNKIATIFFLQIKNGYVSFLPLKYLLYLLQRQKDIKKNIKFLNKTKKNFLKKSNLKNKLTFFKKTKIFSKKNILFFQFFPNVNPITAKKYSLFLRKNNFSRKHPKRKKLFKFV